MVKKYVIVNPDTNQYFTAIYWYNKNVWSRDYKDAKLYSSEDEIKKDFLEDVFEDAFENLNFLKIETFFVND